ncbi:MAG: DUF4783 domain-containing protein [Bacteroidetes bacterium]|nr:DUF4783 domain-containing protein [Bacteroidota bacterium]
MKKQLLFFPALGLILFAFLGLGAMHNRQDALEAVLTALKTGNATKLALRFEETIVLTLPEQTGTATRLQGQNQLASFFSQHPVSAFELKHKGKSPAGSYAIGTLKTQQTDYRVNIFLRGKGGKELIRELRIQTMD